MIEEVVVKKKYCDWCGKSEDDVESFYFFRSVYGLSRKK